LQATATAHFDKAAEYYIQARARTPFESRHQLFPPPEVGLLQVVLEVAGLHLSAARAMPVLPKGAGGAKGRSGPVAALRCLQSKQYQTVEAIAACTAIDGSLASSDVHAAADVGKLLDRQVATLKISLLPFRF
jgi:hypothetical protein